MKPAAGNGSTRVLLAVVEGCRTYDELMARTGFARGTVARHLHNLRGLGLVDWEYNKSATLHPLVEEVPPTSLVPNSRSTRVSAENVDGSGAALTAPTPALNPLEVDDMADSTTQAGGA